MSSNRHLNSCTPLPPPEDTKVNNKHNLTPKKPDRASVNISVIPYTSSLSPPSHTNPGQTSGIKIFTADNTIIYPNIGTKNAC